MWPKPTWIRCATEKKKELSPGQQLFELQMSEHTTCVMTVYVCMERG